jgi:hypothetical protein
MSDKPKRRYRKLNTPEMMASIDRMIAQGQRALHIAQHLHIDSKMVAGRAQRKGYYLAYLKADEHKAILQQRAAKLPTPPL